MRLRMHNVTSVADGSFTSGGTTIFGCQLCSLVPVRRGFFIFFAIHWSKVRERQSIMKLKPCWSKSFESKTYICDVFCQPRELSERSEVKIVTKQLFSSQQYLESIGEIATITINTRSVNICEWVNRADHSH